MKFYSTIILLALIAYINNEDCDQISNPSQKKDCNGKLSDTEKENGYTYCCFIDSKEGKGCLSIKKDDYDNIEDTIKTLEKDSNSKINKFECYSSFLKLGFLNLLFFLL